MKKKVLFLSLVAISFASCSNVDSVDEMSVQREISFRPMTQASSRAIVTGTGFPTGRAIIASASYYDNTGAKVTYFQGQEFKKDGTNAIWRPYAASDYTQIYWPLNDGVDFLAYSLDNTALATSVTWNTTAAANDVSFVIADGAADADDILFAAANNQKKIDPTASYTTGVGMVFKHAQANLNFTIQTNVDVTIHSITFDPIYTGGNLKIDNTKTDLKASWTFTATTNNKVVPRIDGATNTSTGKVIASETTTTAVALGEPLLVLQQDAVGFTIDYTIGGKRSTYKVPVNRQVWEMGKKYTYAIKINFLEITIAPSVTDWDGVTVTPEDINM